ncbi:hypothetical protein EV385_4544 [Krasilnikovia cinnamomea]|uniref:Uncharacterized protein n=1 Tax=Krasilnikovia cinnamomea TaxID=349313 RepID=A0A4V2G7I5_9ACTN|nr:hypothetical protein [Krasilnikovia cinnamomea]RZU52666.1 hypothetical protein EV385_4544 [Krasilnikovia cinnamomea]
MPELTPEQRSMRGRLAAHARWAREDPEHHLPKARAAFMDRFSREVDPDGVLPPAERERRAEHARKRYFTALAFKSSRARSSGRKGLRREGGRSE